jgi:UDP-N-acetyl-D-glucosamine dehydrogenase
MVRYEREATLLGLEEKIRDKSATIGIVGIGYVGLPLAVAFAMAGFRVLGFDVRQKMWIR